MSGAPAARRPVPQAATRGVRVEPLPANTVRMLELQESILDRLVPRLDLDNIPIDRLAEESMWQKAESAIVDLVETLDSSGELPGFVDQDALIKESLSEALGFGPLEDLLADESVQEIIVDRRDRILISRHGQVVGSGKGFSSDETLRRVVERLVAPTGQELSEVCPLIDVRLRDGARLTAAVPPVAARGACLTVRKPRGQRYSLDSLVEGNTISANMADFLATCVLARRNVLVCGAPGSGKSMVLAGIADAIPEGERIVSVEEVAELDLGRDSWIALEARPEYGQRGPAITLRALLESALRMRADRLVVGDVRGAEAMELLSSLASSCDGSLVAGAGESANAALARLVTLAHLAAPGTSPAALRELAASAIDVVVHVARYADGVVRVTSIAEVVGAMDDGFQVRELFCFRGNAGHGQFVGAGLVPEFYRELEQLGMPADSSVFRG